MRKKDVGLVLSIGILLFLAVFSPKKILIAEAFVISSAQLARGESVYSRSCAQCHANGRRGAPLPADKRAWEARLAKGIDRLTVPTARCSLTEARPDGEEFSLATAYMIAVSQGKDG